jgi:NADH-quinone oxidoreductase subunit C
MPDEQKPEGSEGPLPAKDEAVKPPVKPAAPVAPAAKPAPPKPAAPPPPKPPAVMMATPWDGDLARDLKERFGDRVKQTSTYLGQNFIVATPDGVIPVLEYLKLEADFDYLVDITAVDWPKRAERFDLVVGKGKQQCGSNE